MPTIHAEAERVIGATPERVYAALADYRGRHQEILPPQHYVGYHLDSGGEGAGTVFGYRLLAGRRDRAYTLRVAEPATGHVITENDTGSSLVNTWTMTAEHGGDQTRVRLVTEWEAHAQGIGGFFERTFAPSALRGIYATILERLDGVVTGSGATASSR